MPCYFQNKNDTRGKKQTEGKKQMERKEKGNKRRRERRMRKKNDKRKREKRVFPPGGRDIYTTNIPQTKKSSTTFLV